MALELMLEHWNETKAHPPWAPEDLAKKVENAWRYRDHPAGVANPQAEFEPIPGAGPPVLDAELDDLTAPIEQRSEEHTYELQSLMRNSYAVFCLKKKNKNKQTK